MLFEQRFWAGIADGSITATFRRWKKPQVAAGRTNRTPAGIVDVESVDIVTEDEVTDADAIAAGYPDAVSLVADLRGEPGDAIYRIRFRIAERPDPREELASQSELDQAEVAAIAAKLQRLDRASSFGPWTEATLRLIAANRAVRAGDLAPQLGREVPPFKLDVRKLKNLGLTLSLGTGYAISPRGAAFLALRDPKSGPMGR